eukprot:g47612.t1
MDRLERQLDALRNKRVAESIIDNSFRDVVTPKVQADRWMTGRSIGSSYYLQDGMLSPGARVQDVSEQAESSLKGEGEQPEVVVYIGTNDI